MSITNITSLACSTYNAGIISIISIASIISMLSIILMTSTIRMFAVLVTSVPHASTLVPHQ